MTSGINGAPHGRRRRLAGVVTSVCVAAAAFAGCGGDEGGGGEAGGGGGDVAAETTVGILVPFTGELGAFGKPWQKGAQIALDEANATGALPGGTKLKAVVADDETNPETAVTEARKMISTQDAKAIVGPTSGEMVALAPIAERSRTPIISSSAGTIELNKLGGEWLFRTITSDDAEGPALAKYLVDEGAQNVGIFVANDASPISIGTKARESFEANGGKVVGFQKVNLNQSSYRAEVGKMLGNNPDWIVCACGQQAGTSILKELNSAGYDGRRIVTGDLTTPEAIKAVGKKIMEGANGELAAADPDSEGAKAYTAKWKKRYGGEPGPYSSNTYDAVALAALAMIATGSTDGEKIASKIRDISAAPGKKVYTITDAAKALKAGEEIDYDGASGPIDLDETGTSISSFEFYESQNGVWAPIKFYPAEEIREFAGS
jgi:branched-chain amino acid transport system substrate-binding protein